MSRPSVTTFKEMDWPTPEELESVGLTCKEFFEKYTAPATWCLFDRPESFESFSVRILENFHRDYPQISKDRGGRC